MKGRLLSPKRRVSLTCQVRGIGYPLSLELALRGGILVTPNREAYLYCKVAFPLTDKEFFRTEWSNRIYFGFSL